jgi:hypothetical protein
METDAIEKQQPPAAASRDGARHARGVAIVAGAVVVVLVVLLALPGFIAAGFSRMGGDLIFCYSRHGVIWEASFIQPKESVRDRVEESMLAPSGWLKERSPWLQQLYTWEYRKAHGVEYHADFL